MFIIPLCLGLYASYNHAMTVIHTERYVETTLTDAQKSDIEMCMHINIDKVTAATRRRCQQVVDVEPKPHVTEEIRIATENERWAVVFTEEMTKYIRDKLFAGYCPGQCQSVVGEITRVSLELVRFGPSLQVGLIIAGVLVLLITCMCRCYTCSSARDDHAYNAYVTRALIQQAMLANVAVTDTSNTLPGISQPSKPSRDDNMTMIPSSSARYHKID
jgi:hypothetical protein